MKTKKYFSCIIIVVMLITLLSCESWLEENNKSEFTVDNYFTDGVSLQGALTGVYSCLQNIYNGNSHGVGQLGTDESMTTRLSNYRGIIDQYEYTAAETAIQSTWEKYYRLILNANLVINRAPMTPKTTQANINRVIAEAKFLRAFAYFRLAQTFGELPLLTEELESFDYAVGRSPIPDVYNLIIEDLTYAIQDGVLTKNKDSKGVNYWAAQAMLGKVYCTMAAYKYSNKIPGYQLLDKTVGELYQQAKVHLNAVIQSGLYDIESVYGNVFLIKNKNINKESIFEIQFMTQSGYGSTWSKDMGVFGRSYSNAQLINAMVGVTAIKVVPSFWRLFRSTDVRRSWSIADYWIQFVNNSTIMPSGKTSLTTLTTTLPDGTTQNVDLTQDVHLANSIVLNRIGISKYRWGEGDDPEDYWRQPMRYSMELCPNNVIVLRYADVLMMFIEADMGEDGDMDNGLSTTALTYLNSKIVFRARGNKLPTAAFPNYTASNFKLEELIDERGREFCFEFQRWYDLARFGRLKERLQTRVHNSSVSDGGVPYAHLKFEDPKHYLFPIPQRERNLSLNKEGLYQNPGYTE